MLTVDVPGHVIGESVAIMPVSRIVTIYKLDNKERCDRPGWPLIKPAVWNAPRAWRTGVGVIRDTPGSAMAMLLAAKHKKL